MLIKRCRNLDDYLLIHQLNSYVQFGTTKIDKNNLERNGPVNVYFLSLYTDINGF
jgi:hypothetical protein